VNKLKCSYEFILIAMMCIWCALFEEQGYTTLAPGWPDDPETVAEAVVCTLFSRDEDGINHIRHLYLEYVPQMQPYFILSTHDDREGILGHEAMAISWWQVFFNTAGMISVSIACWQAALSVSSVLLTPCKRETARLHQSGVRAMICYK